MSQYFEGLVCKLMAVNNISLNYKLNITNFRVYSWFRSFLLTVCIKEAISSPTP